MKPPSILGAHGKRVTLPESLRPLLPLLRKSAALRRAEMRLDAQLGKALAPLHRSLKRKGDKTGAASVAVCLNECGTFNARFFWELVP